jgi:hypothetical protein
MYELFRFRRDRKWLKRKTTRSAEELQTIAGSPKEVNGQSK